jgi:hypothetical protein
MIRLGNSGVDLALNLQMLKMISTPALQREERDETKGVKMT